MIKILLHTISSRADTCGNRYHKTRITNARNGKSILVYANGESNISHFMREMGYEWEEIYSTREECGYRQLKAMKEDCYEWDMKKPLASIGIKNKTKGKA